MKFRLLLGMLGLTIGLTGCATMKGSSSSSSDQLQTRISQMEDDLQKKDDEINDLKDQVQSLSEEVKSSTSEHSSKSYESAPDVSSKSKDSILHVDVPPDQVQLALKKAGYYNGTVDGKIGEKTKKAVAEFQSAHNLKADGVIGRKTWNVLKAYLDK